MRTAEQLTQVVVTVAAQLAYAPVVEIDDSRTTKVMRRRDWKLVMAREAGEVKMVMGWTWLRDTDVERLHTDRVDPDFTDASIARFDLSGTGLEDAVFGALFVALKAFQRREYLTPENACAAELLAAADLIEYGVSMRTAWPTDEGLAWLSDYETWLAESSK